MMKQRQWGLYAVALAILVVGLVWVGVPVSTMLIAALVLACPLMMMVMMRGMHGGNMSGHGTTREHEQHDSNDRTDDPHHVGS